MRIEATVVVIQIEEGKTFGGILPQKQHQVDASPIPVYSNDGIVPSQRRSSNRRPSLLVSVDEANVAKNASATVNKIPVGDEQIDLETKIQNVDISDTGNYFKNDRRRDSLAGVTIDPETVYHPPSFALTHQDTDMPPPVTRDRLEVDEFPLRTISTAWIKMMTQGLSEWIKLPIIVCRGTEDG